MENNRKSYDIDRRKIYLFGEIDDEAAFNVIQGLSLMDPTKGVEILLSSPGGHEYAGFSIYDAVMAFPGHVTITGYGYVMSMAVPILQAADLRILTPNTDVMVHQGSLDMSSGGSVKQSDIVDLAQQIEQVNDRYYNIIANRSGQTFETVATWCLKDTTFSASEAIELGLADMLTPHSKTFGKPKKRRTKKKA